jgi:hypothetical protein
MSRLVRGRAPGREFDMEFRQKLGPTRILEAAWDLVVTAAAVRGISEDQLRLQRSVTKLERGRHGGNTNHRDTETLRKTKSKIRLEGTEVMEHTEGQGPGTSVVRHAE